MRTRNQKKQLLKFAEAEAYAVELYKDRVLYSSQKKLLAAVRKKFKNNKFTLLATEAAAEAWNYHNETGPWYRDLQEKIGPFNYTELSNARKRVKPYKIESESILS